MWFGKMDIPKVKDVNLKCICCGKKTVPIEPCDDSIADSAMWKHSVVDSISAGYGSLHDTTTFVIAICDECMFVKIQDGSVCRVGSPLDDLSSDEVVPINPEDIDD